MQRDMEQQVVVFEIFMTKQVELERQNQTLDKLDKALENLHHVSKTVGDELEEQITLSQ